MFIPTEGIGSAIARIVKECGINLATLEFYEDKARAEFSIGTTTKVTKPTRKIVTSTSLPEGPWVKTKETVAAPNPGGHGGHHSALYECNGVKATLGEIGEAFGVSGGVINQRFKRSGGYAVTMKHSSKFDKVSRRKRMALA